MAAPIVCIRDLVKDYRRGAEVVRVLDGLSLEIETGGFVALMGPSGSGKSTLLNLIGGIDRPTSGSLEVATVRWHAGVRTTSVLCSRCTTCCRC